VKQAARAFLAMKERIERHVEQRTAMLAGVSHDLRTILTRFRLELSFLEDSKTAEALRHDVDEMQRMLEGYIAFVRGDGGETAEATDISGLLEGLAGELARTDHHLEIDVPGGLKAAVKPNAFKRCLANLVANAVRQSEKVRVSARNENRRLTVIVDDDGPGIPKDQREAVFRPFVRLEGGRNQDSAGTGLGLTIARDIARSHGGDILLDDSPLGGLRARVVVPV
jgi:two-component system osmolarity sensor histidine kinase EnvZ